MQDELTAVDIQKMKEEIEYRTMEVRHKLLEEVKQARSNGDLSENFEYRAAKRELGRNQSRINYLQRMIDTAIVITDRSGDNEVGLFDRVELYMPEDDETETIRVVTTLRQDAVDGNISKESPLGKAVLHRHVGDRVTVRVSDTVQYDVVIRSIETGQDDASLPISKY